jgi:hypothetical protein
MRRNDHPPPYGECLSGILATLKTESHDPQGHLAGVLQRYADAYT